MTDDKITIVPNPRKVAELEELALMALKLYNESTINDEIMDRLVSGMTMAPVSKITTKLGYVTLTKNRLSITTFHQPPPLTKEEEEHIRPLLERPLGRDYSNLFDIFFRVIEDDLIAVRNKVKRTRQDSEFRLESNFKTTLRDTVRFCEEGSYKSSNKTLGLSASVSKGCLTVTIFDKVILKTDGEYMSDDVCEVLWSNFERGYLELRARWDDKIESIGITERALNTRIGKPVLSFNDVSDILSIAGEIHNSPFGTYYYDSPDFDFTVEEDGLVTVKARGYLLLKFEMQPKP